MKKILFTCLAALSVLSATAQFNYTFSKHTSLPYVPLTAGTSMNGTDIWDDEIYPAPLPFTFDMDGVPMDTAWLNAMNFVGTDSTGLMNAFLVFTADLMDKGADTSNMSHSPIRYQVTGTTPNRIAKIEVSNAGFYDEYSNHNTADDSVSFQVWFYETSNIVEFRFGPSYMLHLDEYLYNDSLVVNMGYLHQFDFDIPLLDMFYYVVGDTSAPGIDSTNNIMNSLNEGLNTWPANGTVYRFEPPTASVKIAMAALNQVSAYPTAAQNELYVENKSSEKINYTVLSVNGAAMNISGQATTGKNKIDIDRLAPGNYLLQLTNGSIAKAVKFTKL